MEKQINKLQKTIQNDARKYQNEFEKTKITEFDGASNALWNANANLENTKIYLEASNRLVKKAKTKIQKEGLKEKFEMPDFLDLKIQEQEKFLDLTEQIYESLVSEKISIDDMIVEMSVILHDAGIPTENLDEGIIGRLIGGIAGFFIGPKIGRVIAHALGIEKAILFDMFSSKLVGAALGSAIAKYIGGGHKKKR
jgi:hypothetical protein